MTSEHNTATAYLHTKVMSAAPEELRLMLIEGAIRFARSAREGLANKNFEQSYEGVSSCRDIVVELMTNLRADVDPELCDRVRAIYGFIFQELTEASMAKSTERMDKVIELLDYERETWVLLMDKLVVERGSGTVAHAIEGGSLSIEA